MKGWFCGVGFKLLRLGCRFRAQGFRFVEFYVAGYKG